MTPRPEVASHPPSILLSADPANHIDRIATLAGIPRASICTIELSPGAKELYHAALEYAASHQHAFGPGLDPRPAWIAPEEMYLENNFDLFEDAEEQVPSDKTNVVFSASSIYNLKMKKMTFPRLMFGLGSTAVTWPPPEIISAYHLYQETKAKARSIAFSKSTIQHSERKQTENVTLSHPRPSEDPSSLVTNVETSDMINPSPLLNGQVNLSKMTVYLVHYILGEPMPLERVRTPHLEDRRVLLLVGVNGPQALQEFLEGVLQWKNDKDNGPERSGRFGLFRYKTDPYGGGRWKSEGLKATRPLSTVVLPHGDLEKIVDDVKSFLRPTSKAWYSKHGLPHRRSYMFYGPPGVGKTSTIRALAGEFGLNCCYLSVTTDKFNNQNLCDALRDLPSKPVLVLEDVDALFKADRQNSDGGTLTFSGMLNALDGLTSADGMITIMTTNHIDRLDNALIRGGRVDRRFEFCRPSREQLENLFLSFYPDSSRDRAELFASRVIAQPNNPELRSIATLQQHFIAQRDADAEECIDALPSFFADRLSSRNEE